MDMKEIGKNLKELRQMNEYSTYDVEELTGIKHQNISRYENGQNEPSILQCVKLADLYNCSLDELIFGTAEVKRNINVSIQNNFYK